MYRYWLFLILLSFNTTVWAQYQLKGIIRDDNGVAIPDVRVAIAGNEIYSNSDSKGEFSYTLEGEPQMPIKVNVVKNGYELKEVNFSEDDLFLEVIIRKLPNPDQGKVDIVRISSDSILTYAGISLLIDGYTYASNSSGTITLDRWATYNSDILIPGYQILKKDYNKKTRTLSLAIIPFRLDDEIISSIENPADYKKNFEVLFRQFEMEKKIITESNLKIEKEMTAIINQLQNDSTISQAQRNQLRNYLAHLETLYESNKNTLENVIEKKYNLIFKLNMLISQKDSLTLLSQIELKNYKKKQKEMEEAYRTRMTFYSIILGLVVISLVISIITISKIKKQKNIIQEQNRNLDAFVSKASHEIKGPLNSLKGLVSVSQKSIKDPESLQYFDYIGNTVQKLMKTVNDLLYFSKAKDIKPHYIDINLKQFTDDVINSISFKDGFSNVKITNNIPADVVLKSDETILNSIIQNLVGNAIKYQDTAKQSSYLNIEFQQKDGILMLEFKDNGIGIESMHRHKLFGMFYRATSEAEGTGLGLYIVKLSVEKLGGTIEFESEPKQFTNFVVTLPMRDR